MGRRSRRRNRRRNRRGGKGAGAAKRHSARHGRTDAQMRAAAARRKNKTVKKTSGYHWDGKGKKPLVAAWNTKWKQTKKMPSARKSSSHRVTKKKRSRLGAPPTGHAPAAPSQVSDDLKPISMGSKIASSNVNTAKLAKKTGVSISQVKAGKQAADKAAKIVADSVKGAANQVVTEARQCTGPGKCSTSKSANTEQKLCWSYGEDCMWRGKKAGQKRAHPTWRETATIAAERELEGKKGYKSTRAKTELGNIQAKENAPWAAANASSAFRRSAWDARKKRDPNSPHYSGNNDLKPISKISKIASSNVNTAKLANKTGVSISQVKAGKQAANVAANKVAAAVKEAAIQTVKKGCPPGCMCDHECPCPDVPQGGGRRRSRRRYAKNEARAGPRRRRRSRRR